MKVFVTTYKIGNEQGFAVGKWFDTDDYCSKSEFVEAATEYAQRELGDAEPELCFSDWGLDWEPASWVSEVSIDERVWTWSEYDASEREIYAAYIGHVGDATLDEALEAYVGDFESDVEFAQEQMEEAYFESMSRLPVILRYNFDWESIARDLMHEHFSVNGKYFRHM